MLYVIDATTTSTTTVATTTTTQRTAEVTTTGREYCPSILHCKTPLTGFNINGCPIAGANEMRLRASENGTQVVRSGK